MNSNSKIIKDISLEAMMLALLIISSKISFNIGPIPITLQTFVVILVSLFLGVKKSIFVFLTYIALGLIGLPVFSKNYGGFNYIYEPSFGFIIGFLASSIFVGFFNKLNKTYKIVTSSFFGILIIYILGIIHFYIIFNYHLGLNKDLLYILEVGVMPFIFKDILSAILASIIYVRLNSFLKINRIQNNDLILEKNKTH